MDNLIDEMLTMKAVKSVPLEQIVDDTDTLFKVASLEELTGILIFTLMKILDERGDELTEKQRVNLAYILIYLMSEFQGKEG